MKVAADDWPLISALLDEALELPAAARAQWLAGLAADRQVHRETLSRLLADHAHVETQDFLHTLPRLDAPAGPDEVSAAGYGRVVGPYRLLREIGRGGMGSVWLAERADGLLKRQVALKLPHAGLATEGFAERLARERDILASLTHPHIARLYDAGIGADGQPYIALAFVQGRNLVEHCRVAQLGVRERLALFLQVLGAVQYAHEQLVVHRDLKPSNILVDEAGQVQLLDFGIAKLITEASADAAEPTALGGRALTLDYASPEQIGGARITTASDVYSLGVLLYELLTGERPYRLKRNTPAALEEAILSATVRKPSEAVSSRLAAAERKRLARALRGDLDVITLKALHKAADQRYGSAEAFARDLQRHLQGGVVQARPASWRYRSMRFIARNRLAVAAATVTMAALVAGTGVALWQAGVARRQALTAQAVQTFLLDIFRANASAQPDPLKARETPARVLLDLGARRIRDDLAEVPEAQLDVLVTLAGLYDDLGMTDQSVALHRQRVALARKLGWGRDARLADALIDLGGALYESQTPREQEPVLREAGAILDHLGDHSSPMRAELDLRLAEQYQATDLDRTIAFARQGAALLRGRPPSYSLVQLLTMQGIAHDARREFREAIEVLGEANRLTRSLPQGPRRTDNIILAYLAEAYAGADHFAEAERCYREALQAALATRGPRHEDTLQSQMRLGVFLSRTGRLGESLALLREAKAATLLAFGGDEGFHLPRVRAALAAALIQRGDVDAGVAEMAEAIELRRRQRGGTRQLAAMLERLAPGLVALGRHDDAAKALAEASAIRQRAGDAAGSAQFVDNALARAELGVATGELDAADAALSALAPLASNAPVIDRARVAIARAAVAHARGPAVDASARAAEALSLIEHSAARDHLPWYEAQAQLALGLARLDGGEAAAALPPLTRAVELIGTDVDNQRSAPLVQARQALARCRRQLQPAGPAKPAPRPT